MIHENDEFLERAAKPTQDALDAIKTRIEKRLSKRSGPLGQAGLLPSALTEIRDNYFTPGWELLDLKAALGANNWLWTVLRTEVGLLPWNLVQECRMETATRLLRDTPLSIDEIATLVGYQDTGAFRRLCVIWCGLTPGVLRGRVKRYCRRLAELGEDAFSWRYWQACCRGELSRAEVRRLVEYLEALYGGAGEAP